MSRGLGDVYKRQLFVLEFCHFIHDVSCSGPLWVPLDWDSLCFLDLCDFSSHPIGEVFHHYFFKQVVYPFSSPSGIPVIQILLHFILSFSSLKTPSFLPFDPAIPLLGLYPKNPETPIHKNLCLSLIHI